MPNDILVALETVCDLMRKLDPISDRAPYERLTAHLEDLCILQSQALQPKATVAFNGATEGVDLPTEPTVDTPAIDPREDALRTIAFRANVALEGTEGVFTPEVRQAREDLRSIIAICSQNLPLVRT